MADQKYTITRTQAANMLGVSTRTIDRYVKGGKLSYKKVANKVLLNMGELEELKQEFSVLQQQVNAELVGNQHVAQKQSTQMAMSGDWEQALDKKIDRFFDVFHEKDKVIEDKNKVIFMLQQRLGEMESRVQNMVALPDHNHQKQSAMLEKQRLETALRDVQGNLKNEKMKNIVYIGIVLIIVFVAMILYLNSK